MARSNKYGIRELKRDFPTNKSCLEFIFDSLHTRDCTCGGIHTHRTKRKSFQCSRCRSEIAPTAGTIFHKSRTPLTLWFHALLVFSNAKSGVSAKELERHLGVTYKCAWRILSSIRKHLPQVGKALQGYVEADGAYFGGRRKAGKDNEYLRHAMKKKGVVLGAIQRGGKMRAEVVPNMAGDTIKSFVEKNIEPKNTFLLTDRDSHFKRVDQMYDRHSVDHHRLEFVRGYVHINSIENFWSHAKRSITGTHKTISKKHLQSYLDAFVFHYDNRRNDRKRFESLLQILLHSSKQQEIVT